MTSGSFDVARALTRSTRWVIGGALLGKAVQVGGHAVVVRLITPDAFGLFTLSLFVVAIVQTVCDFGVGNAMLQHPEEGVQHSGLTLLMASSALFFCAGMLFADPLALAIGDARLAGILRVMSARLLVVPFSTVAQVRLARKLRYGELTAASLVSGFAGAVIAICLAYSGFGVWALVAGDLSALAAQGVLVWILAGGLPAPGINRLHVRRLGGFGTFVLLETLLGSLIVTADGFLLGKQLGPEKLGLYRLGSSVAMAVLLTITGPFMGVVFAALARLTTARERFNATFFDALRLMTHLNCAWSATLIPCAGLVIGVVFGPAWAPAAPVAAILAAFAAIASPGMVPPQAYRALGKPKINALFLATQFIAVVPLFLYGARRGEVPLAWLQLLQGVVFTGANLCLCSRVLGVRFGAILSTLGAPFLVGALVLAWNGLLLRLLGGLTGTEALAIHAVTGPAVWMGLVYALDRKTWRTLGQVVSGGTL